MLGNKNMNKQKALKRQEFLKKVGKTVGYPFHYANNWHKEKNSLEIQTSDGTYSKIHIEGENITLTPSTQEAYDEARYDTID